MATRPDPGNNPPLECFPAASAFVHYSNVNALGKPCCRREIARCESVNKAYSY